VKMFLTDCFAKVESPKYSGYYSKQGNWVLTITAAAMMMVVITVATKSKTTIFSAYAMYACSPCWWYYFEFARRCWMQMN